MPAKQLLSMLGSLLGRTWLSADELLGDHDNTLLFKCFQVTGQVPVGQFEELFKRIEIELVVHNQGRHESEPDAAFKYFLNVRNWILHA